MVSGERRPTLPCLVVCPPGLEDVVTAELDDLGIRARRTGKGSISAVTTSSRPGGQTTRQGSVGRRSPETTSRLPSVT